MLSQVLEFHTAFGLYIGDHPHLPDQAIRDLRINLLQEEINEFFDAEKVDDFIESCDAVVDCLYIINGTAISYGLYPQPLSGLELYDFNSDEVRVGISGRKYNKPVYPDIKIRNQYHRSLNLLFESYLNAEAKDDLDMIDVTLNDLNEYVVKIGYAYRLPMKSLFDEVHASNMSKLDNGKVVRRADGKVMKGPDFRPPQIAKILGLE